MGCFQERKVQQSYDNIQVKDKNIESIFQACNQLGLGGYDCLLIEQQIRNYGLSLTQRQFERLFSNLGLSIGEGQNSIITRFYEKFKIEALQGYSVRLLVCLIILTSHGSTSQKATLLFDNYDENRDRHASPDEIRTMFKDLLKVGLNYLIFLSESSQDLNDYQQEICDQIKNARKPMLPYFLLLFSESKQYDYSPSAFSKRIQRGKLKSLFSWKLLLQEALNYYEEIIVPYKRAVEKVSMKNVEADDFMLEVSDTEVQQNNMIVNVSYFKSKLMDLIKACKLTDSREQLKIQLDLALKECTFISKTHNLIQQIFKPQSYDNPIVYIQQKY